MRTYQEYLALAEHYRAIGQKAITLYPPYGEDDTYLLSYPWEHVTSMSPPHYYSGAIPNDPHFEAEIGELSFHWGVSLYDGSRKDDGEEYRYDRLLTIAPLLPEHIRADLVEALTTMLKTYHEDTAKSFDWYRKSLTREMGIIHIRDKIVSLDYEA